MEDMKTCPFCSEEIRASAIKCKHCSSLLSGGEASRTGPSGPSADSDWAAIAGPLPVGTVVENYRVERVVGKGGMGEVYLARHELSQQEVALKVVSPLLMKVEGVAARFLKEAQTMARLRHPNIVQLYNFFEAGGRFFMVMEYLPGQSLKDRLKQGPLPVPEAVRIAQEVLTGLQFAHTRTNAVIHRDIKPDNILLTESGRVVLIDFGVAKALGTEKLTRTGSTVGTCEYMSPEQVMAQTVGPATDQYAFGITLFKMLTGSVPFPQESDSGFEVMRAHLERQPPALDSLRAGLPPWLQQVVSKALAKRPEERFATAAKMAEALQAGLANAGETNGTIAIPEIDPLAATRTVAATPVPEPVLPPGRRRGLRWAIPAGILVVLALLLALWKPWQGSQSPGERASAPPPVETLSPRQSSPQRAQPAEKAAGEGRFLSLLATPGKPDTMASSPEDILTPTEVHQEAGGPSPAVQKEPTAPPIQPSLDVHAEPETAAPELALPHCRNGMCLVPEGDFVMGCSAQASGYCTPREAAERIVSLPEFWIDRTEVTFGQYDACVRAGACPSIPDASRDCLVPQKDRFVKGQLPAHFVAPDRPVVCADWHMADAFCRYAGKHLPTEAQWEKAARGTDGRLYPWGDTPADCSKAIMNDETDPTPLRGRGCRFATTWPVCSKGEAGSTYGLCDMAGNVWEWVADPWVEAPTGLDASGQILGSSDVTKRSMKGGSWTRDSRDLRSSFRDWEHTTTAGCGIGFRCVRETVQEP